MDENQIKEKTDAAIKAIKELGVVLADKALFGELATRNRPLQEQADEQEREHDESKSTFHEMTPCEICLLNQGDKGKLHFLNNGRSGESMPCSGSA